jgi:hypothetical protein
MRCSAASSGAQETCVRAPAARGHGAARASEEDKTAEAGRRTRSSSFTSPPGLLWRELLAGVSIDFGTALRLPPDTRTPPRFTRDGVHSVGATYLCEKSTACERRGRRLELKATPAPGRLLIV